MDKVTGRRYSYIFELVPRQTSAIERAKVAVVVVEQTATAVLVHAAEGLEGQRFTGELARLAVVAPARQRHVVQHVLRERELAALFLVVIARCRRRGVIVNVAAVLLRVSFRLLRRFFLVQAGLTLALVVVVVVDVVVIVVVVDGGGDDDGVAVVHVTRAILQGGYVDGDGLELERRRLRVSWWWWRGRLTAAAELWG